MATTEVKTLSATVVEENTAGPTTEVKTLSATVIERTPDFGGLAQPNDDMRPQYIIENGTPYVKFEPNTNNKKLFFYPSDNGPQEYSIIALRPNLLDFFESTQTFTSPEQVEVPHFNQLFMTNRILTPGELNAIKVRMLEGATGTGINIDAGTENSVSGGLQDPVFPA